MSLTWGIGKIWIPAGSATASSPWQKGSHAQRDCHSKFWKKKTRSLNTFPTQKPWQKAVAHTPCSPLRGCLQKWWGMMGFMWCSVEEFVATYVAPCCTICATWMAGANNLSSHQTDCRFFGHKSRKNTKPKRHLPDWQIWRCQWSVMLLSLTRSGPSWLARVQRPKGCLQLCCQWSSRSWMPQKSTTNTWSLHWQPWCLWSTYLMTVVCSLTKGLTQKLGSWGRISFPAIPGSINGQKQKKDISFTSPWKHTLFITWSKTAGNWIPGAAGISEQKILLVESAPWGPVWCMGSNPPNSVTKSMPSTMFYCTSKCRDWGLRWWIRKRTPSWNLDKRSKPWQKKW